MARSGEKGIASGLVTHMLAIKGTTAWGYKEMDARGFLIVDDEAGWLL